MWCLDGSSNSNNNDIGCSDDGDGNGNNGRGRDSDIKGHIYEAGQYKDGVVGWW